MDPVNGISTGTSFTVKYHYVDSGFDILVMRQKFDMGLYRNWQPSDRFRVVSEDNWFEGLIVTREPLVPYLPHSFLLSFCVR